MKLSTSYRTGNLAGIVHANLFNFMIQTDINTTQYIDRLKWRDMLADCLFYRYAKKLYNPNISEQKAKQQHREQKTQLECDDQSRHCNSYMKKRRRKLKTSPTNEQKHQTVPEHHHLMLTGKISNRFCVFPIPWETNADVHSLQLYEDRLA